MAVDNLLTEAKMENERKKGLIPKKKMPLRAKMRQMFTSKLATSMNKFNSDTGKGEEPDIPARA
jgi:hypothetical protein